MAKLIIGFTGEPGSGKDVATNYLIERYQAEAFAFSSILRDLVHRLYFIEDRLTIATMSQFLREKYGDDLFGKVIAKDIERAGADLVVVSGIRRDEDMSGLVDYDNFHLIYIEATPETRLVRIKQRGQNADDASKTLEQLLRDGELEAERRVRGLKQQSREVIDNDASVDEFHAKLDSMMKRLLGAPL